MKKILLFSLILIISACNDEAPVNSGNSQTRVSTQAKLKPKLKSPDKVEVEYSDLTAFKALSIVEGLFENAPALQINLTLPIDERQNIAQLVQITQDGNSVAGDWIYSANRMVLYFPFIESGTQYRINIDNQLTAINGKSIDKSYQQIITTNQKRKDVRFLSKANTLLKDSNKLPIEAVNVDGVDLKFWRIKPEQYQQFLKNPNRKDIYYLERLSEVADLVHTSRFALDSVKNKTETHNLSLRNIQPLQAAGIYFVTMIAADSYPYEVESSWFAVTDIGVHARRYPKSLSVFTHKIPEASVYVDVELALYNPKGNQLETKKTDHNGFAKFSNTKLDQASLLIASKGNNTNIIRLNQVKMDLSEFALSNRDYKPQELFIYAPRDLYRPGETVNINALLRDQDGNKVSASPIRVEIKRPDNRTYKNINWQGDESSFYQSEFKIPNDAMTGTWKFIAKLANQDVFEYDFAVEDFLPEKLKLALSSGNESLHIGMKDKPKIHVQSDFLYGAPAAKNRFDATVTVTAANTLFDEYQEYVFGSNNYKDFNLNFTTASKQLDDNGTGELEIQPNWLKTQFPLRIKSFVNVYESGGRPISRKITQTVWPHEKAIGVRKLWEGKYASPRTNNEIELIAVDKSGKRIAVNNAEVLLIRENAQRYWHWGDDGWSYNQSQKNIPVYSRVFTIDAAENNTLSLPLEYGNYRVEIRDSKQQLISSYQFFSGWSWYNQNSANGDRPDLVKLEWLSDSLVPGTNAELKISAPYAGNALIAIESDHVLWKKNIQMNSAQQTIEIPIDLSWNRHDIHASVMVIQAGEVKRKHLPKRALGVIHLPLNRENRKLDITIENQEKVLPDREVTIRVKAANLDASKDTFVTLAAVDTGVLNVSNFKSPNPHEWFFSARKYIAELHDMYGSIIALLDGKDVLQKFGGDADLARGGDEPSSDVQIVSMISEKVKFDADGIANIKLKLPYFNGEVRLMAVAFNDNQFAGAESFMKIAAPVVVETSMPRFLAKGDATFATVDIHNTEEQDLSIDLTIIASDSLGGSILDKKLKLAANEKTLVKFPITAIQHQGSGNVNVVANTNSNAEFVVNRSWNIGLRPAFPAIIKSKTAVVDSGKGFDLGSEMFENFDQSNLKSILKVSNVAVLNADAQLQHLIQYPYGCLEQTTSRAWPLLMVEESDLRLLDNDQQLKIFSERSELIDGAISRLLGMIRYDGSYGLWSSDGNEEYWLTVYVTDFLIKAKNMGYNVPEKQLSKSIKRLQYYVKGRAYLNSDLGRYLSSVKHYKVSYQSYAAYVLAGVNQVNLQDIRKLYDTQFSQVKSPLPLAYLAMALEKMGDSRRAREAWVKAIDFKWSQDRYSYYGDYGSKIRDLAQVVLLGTQSNIANGLSTSSLQLIKPLQEELSTRRWLSTQERGTIFRVAKALKNNANLSNKWQATLAISENNQAFDQASDLVEVWYDEDANRQFTMQNTGTIPLYVDFKTQGYLSKAVPESNGIQIERRYFNLQGDEINVSNINSGDTILVHVKMKLQKDYNYLPDAMLIELLPAGLELENQNLEHSMKLDDIKIDNKKIVDWQKNTRVHHTEYRDDRFVAALSLSKYNDNNLFYLARAVTPGTYTVPPSLVEDMYRPEIRAIGKTIEKMVISE